MRLVRVTCLLLLSLLPQLGLAEQINVAVASNFTAPMKAIVTAFEQQSEHRVKLSFGSSGKFFAQITHGAPFELFFSADQTKPKALEESGLIVPGSRFTYAIGALALWSSNPTLLKNNAGALKQGQFTKLALANPKLAPYGLAAVEVLEHLALTEHTKAKWVQGENIAQTYQFISTGNADIGFVAMSQIMQQGQINLGSSWLIPHELYSPIKQDAALLARGKNSPAAKALLTYIQSNQAKAIIESYGYTTPYMKN
jgi:molybdate transport system substrate-binding protein